MGGKTEYPCALVAGATAGLSVDLFLFPVDTVKTRLQSQQGFLRAGGFSRIYAGLGSTAVGSMPGAALFFCSYEAVKSALAPGASGEAQVAVVHMAAAACGETVACLARVPTEVVKQRAQATRRPSLTVLAETMRAESVRGLYRGYLSTVAREIPFSFIQFPLWEALKRRWSERRCGGAPLAAWQSGACGACAGGVAAALTTPLDVAKTRIMLAEVGSPLAGGGLMRALRAVYSEGGATGLFAGIVPRVLWISVGGCVFLGVYDKVKAMCTTYS